MKRARRGRPSLLATYHWGDGSDGDAEDVRRGELRALLAEFRDVDDRARRLILSAVASDLARARERLAGVRALRERGVELSWFTSHIFPDVVLWSTHPELLPPSGAPPVAATDGDVDAGRPNVFYMCADGAALAPPAAADADAHVKAAAQLVHAATHVLVLAGAGMSVDSGLPDYRGPEGFWRQYPPLAHLGLTLDDIASAAWFKRDPELAWGVYGHKWRAYRDSKPHSGYTRLRDLCRRSKRGFFVCTSNVDGLFLSADFGAKHVHECHGSLSYLQCSTPCRQRVWELTADMLPPCDPNSFRALGAVPRCPHCGAVARPNVSFFDDDEESFVADRSGAQRATLLRYLGGVTRSPAHALLVLEIGCGVSVHSLRFETAALQASGINCQLIRINPSHCDAGGPGKAAGETQVEIALGCNDAMRLLDGALAEIPGYARKYQE